ncbi:hypothetical protein MFMK1_000912 [Metallumcola ferriviriculae]|uniref:Uncharacterized protein n=1 Tax=Metallumcola ferriviriculae TaxID=3039180 RepID=A0AAU0UKR5_9FIRM|nr:hypothetical protein MFMK1_000912 [Desulfitibacteraceae bacterium MK1]
MTPSEAMGEIKRELENVFGKGLTGIIMISARKIANPSPIMKKEHYLEMVQQICVDKRVVEMLGAAGAKQKSNNWKKLLD